MHKARNEAWPCRFVLYSRNEHAQDACRRKYPDARYVLGDIRDVDRLTLAMLNQDVVLHTAALKYVDIAEQNISECIDINIGGTRAVILAAKASRSVHTVVGVSTDKAVEPSNTYGLSKAVGEKLLWEAEQTVGAVGFAQVRYGNVIGSTGSVVPKFKYQYEQTGAVTVTDPVMTRFWISVDEAVNLILAAFRRGKGFTVIPVPKAMRLHEMVKAVVPNAVINVVGLRPGEKLHEKLLTHAESIHCGYREDERYYYYRPDVPLDNQTAFELTSDTADAMSQWEFRKHVSDAELI